MNKKGMAALLCLLSTVAGAAERNWTDKASGRDYTLLDKPVSYAEAERECGKRGMVMSDLRYLGDDERKELWKAEAFESLEWETKYPGTKRELRFGRLWQASGLSAVVVGSTTGYATLAIVRKGDRMTATSEYRDEREGRANAICMSVPDFWFYCNMELRCGIEGTTLSIRYKFHDHGASEAEALKRIVDRTQEPAWAVKSERCSVLTESKLCLRVHPKR